MAEKPRLTRGGIAAATSGNILEWYDFTAYGFLAPIIGAAFFPAADPLAATLSAFAALAVGYLARPIGSVIFGHIGDKVGRKPALLISIVLMGVASLAIALLPTYAQIGIAAPILLVLIRVVQGIAVAGEYTSSGVLVVEMARKGTHNVTGSLIAFAMMIGCVVGSGVPALVSSHLTQAEMAEWGWRIPFAFGMLVALTSLIMRTSLLDTAEPQRDRATPLIDAVKSYWPQIVSMFVMMMPVAILYFLVFVYASSFLTDQMHVSTATALDFSTINLVVVALCIIPIGLLADRIGARTVLLVSSLITLAVCYPLWTMMHNSNLTLVFIGQMAFAMINSVGWALSVTTLANMVPAKLRCSAGSIGSNGSMAIFGGTTPFVAAYLVSRTSDDYAPIYYLIAATLLALVAIWRLQPGPPKMLDEDPSEPSAQVAQAAE